MCGHCVILYTILISTAFINSANDIIDEHCEDTPWLRLLRKAQVYDTAQVSIFFCLKLTV